MKGGVGVEAHAVVGLVSPIYDRCFDRRHLIYNTSKSLQSSGRICTELLVVCKH